MPQLILLHGALGTRESFGPLARLLRDDFELFIPDFKGHGSNNTGSPFTIRELSEQVAGLIKTEGLQRPSIFGYSMGGYAALRMAAETPQLAGAIVTLGTKFDWSPEVALRESSILDPEKITAKVPAFASWLEKLHGTEWKSVCRETAAMMTGLAESPEIDFGKIISPVMIIRGENDALVSEAESRHAADSIPQGSFTTLENAPHPLEKVDPNALSHLLKSFFL